MAAEARPTARHPETVVIHGRRHTEHAYGALAAPLYQTSTFSFRSAAEGAERFAGGASGYVYTRLGNPTVRELEERLAALEGAEDAVAFASGMGAVSAALLASLKAGDHLITSRCLYGCTHTLIDETLAGLGISATRLTTITPESLRLALRPQSRVLYLETPVNPTLEVIEIAPLAEIAHRHGMTVIVDNTFMTPLLQKPLASGADLAVHSATKFLNGHGDVIAGAVCGAHERLEALRHGPLKTVGAVLDPFAAWLIMRGLKTLALRLARHQDNAGRIAHWLRVRPEVRRVTWPGFDDHPAAALRGTQMHGGGALLTFELHGGDEAAVRFLDRLDLCRRAVSLGDAETLVEHPASMTHATYDAAALAAAGIRPGLIRLAAGLEHPSDLIADLEQALAASGADRPGRRAA